MKKWLFVSLLIMVGCGSVEEEPPNQPPVAIIAPVPAEAPVWTVITFDAVDSYDPEGCELTFEWELVEVPEGSHVKPIAEKDYRVRVLLDRVGRYEIEVLVTDCGGLTDFARSTINSLP